jgi:hypothetical protein
MSGRGAARYRLTPKGLMGDESEERLRAHMERMGYSAVVLEAGGLVFVEAENVHVEVLDYLPPRRRNEIAPVPKSPEDMPKRRRKLPVGVDRLR